MLGQVQDEKTRIYVSKNGTPEENVGKVLEMMGGIATVIGSTDIVIIKPNAQWVGHGGTNTDTIKGLIDLVLGADGFEGEIIIADNHHDDPDNSRAWTTTNRNGSFNLNELVEHYHVAGHFNVTKYHWRDAGLNPYPLQFRAGNGSVVSCPEDGDGYVWSTDEYSYQGRKVKMSYPIFTSSYSGVVIDFRNGVWMNGKYCDRPLKFINISALNHHSGAYAGVTASVKNYLGVVDMTCGRHGLKPKGYYNFHYIARGWSKNTFLGRLLERMIETHVIRRSSFLTKSLIRMSPLSGAIGGAVGYFIKTIRAADLNIIAAEFSGYEGRWKTPAHTRTVLASKDPVALDYYAAKHVLLPLGGSRSEWNDPDNLRGPFRQYLDMCHAEGIGSLNENQMVPYEHDFGNTTTGSRSSHNN